MKIGYYVQGAADAAVIFGLAERWCPHASFAEGQFRGMSGESFRREIRRSLLDLKEDKGCDVLVVLTDADNNEWRQVKNREVGKIPEDCRHVTLFGVADRNIECWLASDRNALSVELGCRPEEIPRDDPSDFIKRRFGLGNRSDAGKERVRQFVIRAELRSWIGQSRSFADFYDNVRSFAVQTGCAFPNEREN